jgi:RNA 2',3'-cyclic 3'-phosphodiesterase
MRCFLAIELPTHVRDSLADLQNRLASLTRDVRWTAVDQIHLTVKFLGEVPDATAARVCDVASRVARDHPPFELQVSGTGCFPPRGPARIVWAGLADLPQSLVDCQKACEQAYAALGFAPENRAFHPHLTVGRVRDQRGSYRVRPEVEAHAQFEGGRFTVGELVMFQSVLDRGGPTYIPLVHAPLIG